MKTLEDVKSQFEDKTKGGYEVNILAYHPDQERPIIAEILRSNRWVGVNVNEGGAYNKNGIRSDYDLIKKKYILPKDILCEVWAATSIDVKHKRYSDGDGEFYQGGATSSTDICGSTHWDNYRVIENEPKPWFGGECPIPEWCKYRVGIDSIWHKETIDPAAYDWSHAGDITAYQILGEIDNEDV